MSSRTPRLAAAFAVAARLAIGTLVQVRLSPPDPRRHAAAAGGGAGTSLGGTSAGTLSSGRGAAGTTGPGRTAGEPAYQPVPAETSSRRLLEDAFAVARQRDYALARARFAQFRREAAGRPWTVPAEDFTTEAQRAQREEGEGKGNAAGREAGVNSDPEAEESGRRRGPDGQLLPTLEEEAAYQGAELTGMPDRGFPRTGAKAAAPAVERALLAFMRQYPESPLAAAARWRIMRRHQGELAEEAERVWRAAQATARKRREAREKARNLCGPLLAAGVLRRWGAPADETGVPALARELATDHQGTTLLSLARLFRRRGLQAEGQRLTSTGLRKAWLSGLFTTEAQRAQREGRGKVTRTGRGRVPSGREAPPRGSGASATHLPASCSPSSSSFSPSQWPSVPLWLPSTPPREARLRLTRDGLPDTLVQIWFAQRR